MTTRFGTILLPALFTVTPLPAAVPEPYELDNGLRVLLRPVPAARQVAVVVLFDLGGDHDPPGKSGRAHLLEHLYCTAATAHAPVRDFAAIQMRYGTGYNQQTGSDYTVFAGVVATGRLDAELQDTAARMSDLKMTEADLQREVPRVLHELSNMFGGIPSLAGVNRVRKQVHPIARGGQHGGHPEHVPAITLEELQQLWHDYYRPKNAILVVAGGFEEAEARKLVAKHFGPIEAGKESPEPATRPEPRTGGTKTVTVKPVMPDAIGVASIGYAAPPPGSKHYPAFLLLVNRLFATAAQAGMKPGGVMPLYYPPLDDPTTIALQAAVPDDKDPAAVLQELDDRLHAALAQKIDPQETAGAVQSLAMLGTMDLPDAVWARNPYGLAFATGRQFQLGIDGKQLATDIEALTGADMKALAKDVFAPEKRAAVIVEMEK